MPAFALIGAQWGDEGKGKIVDCLAEKAHWVVRYAGGNNAGHTVINDMGEFALHLVPSGVFWPQVSCLIGNGVVIDPNVFFEELNGLQGRGIDISNIHISDRAHIIMPYHIQQDKLEEIARGNQALGTTGRGVGPAYVDKTARMGIRSGELLDQESLLPRLKQIVEHKNRILTKIYDQKPLSVEEIYEQCIKWGSLLKPYLGHTEVLLQDALNKGHSILLEGAQGTMLDLDHGTYPYVTSSSSAIGGAATGLGFSPQSITSIIGVFKAYSTRVGSGPLPSEMNDASTDILRERAWEYGATTGRARRIGWFDAVAGRYSKQINGFTSLVLTRLDVLDGFPSVKLCVGYRIDGNDINYFPANTAFLEKCEPVYEEMPGWDKPTGGCTHISQLPKEALSYVKRIEKLLDSKFQMISTGPHRHETIYL